MLNSYRLGGFSCADVACSEADDFCVDAATVDEFDDTDDEAEAEEDNDDDDDDDDKAWDDDCDGCDGVDDDDESDCGTTECVSSDMVLY